MKKTAHFIKLMIRSKTKSKVIAFSQIISSWGTDDVGIHVYTYISL